MLTDVDYALCKGGIAMIGRNLNTLLKRLENSKDGIQILKDTFTDLKLLNNLVESLYKKEAADGE